MISKEASYLTLGASPDVYISICGVNSTTRECYSRSLSGSVSQEILEWNEKHLMFMKNPFEGFVVFNVMSQGVFSADEFVGQAVLDLSHLPRDLGKEININSGIHGDLDYPVFNSSGLPEVYHLPTHGGGLLRLKITETLKSESLCGWAFLISTTMFGELSSAKIWLALHDSELIIYKDKLNGDSDKIKILNLQQLFNIYESIIEISSVSMTALNLQLSENNVVEESIITFMDDSYDLRSIWIAAIYQSSKKPSC